MPALLPDKLAKPPLGEAVLEIRFQSSNESVGDLLPYVLFSALRSDLDNVEPLPIGAIPRHVRNTRPELLYSAHVKLTGKNRIVQVGDRCVTVSQLPPYDGWPSFRGLGQKVFEAAKETGLVNGIERYSIKVVNIIEPAGRHPLSIINGSVVLGSYDISQTGFQLNAELKTDPFTTIVQIASEASTTMAPIRTGVMVSLDTIRAISDKDLWGNLVENFDRAHATLKQAFFGLIKPEVVKEWEPV